MSAAAEFTRITENPKAEFTPLFQKSPLGVALCQSTGSVTLLNPALERMLGGKSGTASSLGLSDLIPTQDCPESRRVITELLQGQRDSFQLDCAAGDGRFVRWTVWRFSGREGVLDQVLALAQDLSCMPGSEHQLKAGKLEAVGRLAGGVAHDFNNLLTGVLLYCDLLMSALDPDHRARKYAEEIRKAGLQATGLVRQLLAIARPTPCETRLLSLNEIAEGMRNLLVRLIGENIELKFELDFHLGLVRMDPTQAQQILLNLVLNARDAMPHGGQITVKTSNCKVQVLANSGLDTGSRASLLCTLFVVEDNGAGMDASTRAHLFEPFFTTKAGKGTGLGLATVHDIVTRNGGLIHVDSELGRGTRVSVLLPIVPPAMTEAQDGNGFHPVKNGEVRSSKKED